MEIPRRLIELRHAVEAADNRYRSNRGENATVALAVWSDATAALARGIAAYADETGVPHREVESAVQRAQDDILPTERVSRTLTVVANGNSFWLMPLATPGEWDMTEYLAVDGGTIAYEVTGSGPLIVLAHGMGDSRAAYRAVVRSWWRPVTGSPRWTCALRRVGVDWPEWSRTAIAGDLLALIRHLGGPAVLVGHSVSGGAATIAAAREPSLVTSVVELAPFTRKQSVRLGDLRVRRFRRGMLRLLGAGVFGSLRLWRSYLDVAYPGAKPADWPSGSAASSPCCASRPDEGHAGHGPQRADRRRRAARQGALPGAGRDGHARSGLGGPARGGSAVVDALPSGLGRLEMIRGRRSLSAPQFPDQVVSLVLAFLRSDAARA
ncbi:alpha/beta hydrolase [Streptomyces sp. ARC32]